MSEHNPAYLELVRAYEMVVSSPNLEAALQSLPTSEIPREDLIGLVMWHAVGLEDWNCATACFTLLGGINQVEPSDLYEVGMLEEFMGSFGDVPNALAWALDMGADISRRGINDWTPLHYAAARNYSKCVALLLERGADPEARTNIDDYTTPIEEAAMLGKRVAVEVLLEHGVAHGKSAALARSHGHLELATIIETFDVHAKRWSVWRQGDDGNALRMRRKLSKKDAEKVVERFERRGHKQLYWVAKDE
ncbi:MAG: ankyrin repeat domain-containing protein [Planctomycetaceae bacterium]|nr:ankyrin repeat domain-containing protein [Planctomycetaceae bacterium]MCA9045373.1 ankyrin repeat domain-containing protein [Planctomycetaceae bacterium]